MAAPKSLAEVASNLGVLPEILKLQLQTPVVTPLMPYTFIEATKHRATMTAGPYGVDVVLKPSPNRPTSAYHHFMVPWHNIVGVFYALPAQAAEAKKVEAVAEATLGD